MNTRRSGSNSRPIVQSFVAGLGALLLGLIAACGSSDRAGAPRSDADQAVAASTTSLARASSSASTGASSPDEGGHHDDASVDGFNVEAVRWRACGDLQCASVAVPADHDDPGGSTIGIELVRVEATGDHTVGTIFVNPGGPGASGVAFVRGGFRLDATTMERYHLVGFDPRGVGGSSPLPCPTDRSAAPLADLSPDSSTEASALDAEARAVGRRCADAAPQRLALIGTDSVVADVDLLRAAVGDERLHYYGFSYGSLIGLHYAERHPDRVGRLVLDGVVDPTLGLTGLLRQQATAFEQTFLRIDAACGSELTCPDGGLVAGFDRVRAELEASGPIDGIGVAEFELATLVAMYNRALWSVYATALGQADGTGGGGRDLAGIARLYRILSDGADYAAYVAVSCYDSPHPTGSVAWDTFASELAAVAPRFGAAVANEIRACAHWPVAGAQPGVGSVGPITAPGADPILVIGNTGDPATPPTNARTVAGMLDAAALLIVEAEGHTAYGANDCVIDVVARHFADGSPAGSNLSC